MFGIRYPLLDKSDGGTGGGSGGGEAAKPFSDEQQAAISQIVNSAVTSQLKRGLAPAIGDALKGMNWAETLKLDETLDAKLGKILNELDGDDDAGGKGGAGGNQPAKPDPKIAALEANLAELKKLREQDAEALKKEKEASRDKDARAALRSALTPLVRADALDIATRDLFDGQRRVTYDEQGNPLLTVRRAPYAGAAEEDMPMPLADGVQHWIKTSEGKFFAPAPGGSGQQPTGGHAPRRLSTGSDGLPRYDQPATTDAEKIRRADEHAQALAAKYPHLAGQ